MEVWGRRGERVARSLASSGEEGGHLLVEHAAEEVEPFLTGDLAITVGIEGLEEGVEILLGDVLALALSAGDGDELVAVDVAVTIAVELVVFLTNLGKGLTSDAGFGSLFIT